MDGQLPDPTSDALSDDILSGMHEWRLQHPDATLTEIEQALDQRWYRLRAKLLQDLALEREVANWQAQTADRPTCPECGRTLIRRGRQVRQLKKQQWLKQLPTQESDGHPPMKPRYFESYFNADPMAELSEAEAHGSGTYVLEDGGPMRRYRRFIDNELRTLIYAGWTDLSNPIADLKSLDAGVPAEIYSPVEPSGNGYRWRVWYVTPAGEVQRIIENDYSATRDIRRVNVRSPGDELVSYTVYHYHDGALYELTTHAPDGTVTNRQDAAL